jgi:hypothetical protein
MIENRKEFKTNHIYMQKHTNMQLRVAWWYTCGFRPDIQPYPPFFLFGYAAFHSFKRRQPH